MVRAQQRSKAAIVICAALALAGCKKESTVDPGSATADNDVDEDADEDTDDGPAESEAEAEEAEPLNKANFDETVHEHFSEVSDCYVAALEGNPALAGTLEAEFQISAEGQVVAITAVEGSSLTDEGLLACINQAATGWAFAKPADGELRLRYTFNLQPG